MRGANVSVAGMFMCEMETSPHAWSKLVVVASLSIAIRNISTCVEQTYLVSCLNDAVKKHLHMRGANSFQQVFNR